MTVHTEELETKLEVHHKAVVDYIHNTVDL